VRDLSLLRPPGIACRAGTIEEQIEVVMVVPVKNEPS